MEETKKEKDMTFEEGIEQLRQEGTEAINFSLIP